MTYDRQGQQVFYQGKDQTSTYDPIDFLAYASLHIPDKGEQLLRYYGWYSNKSRGHQHPMRVIAFIEKDPAIQKILKHLGLWESRSHSPPPSLIYEKIVYADESSQEVCPKKDKILARCLKNRKDEPHNTVRQRGLSHYASCLNILHIPLHTPQAKFPLTEKYHPES